MTINRYLTFLRTLIRNRRQADDLPRFLTYIVTFTCNARCIMCDSWKKPSPGDLTIEEIERIFRQLPQMDVVRLSGGEPFVRRDLLDIAHLAQTHLRPLMLHITTNGFMTKRIIEFCEQRRKDVPLHMLISVDGVGEKHNQVRGSAKAWDSVMQTLLALAPRRRELRLKLAINQTIVDAEGARHYRELREVMRPLGVGHNFVMAYDASATYSTESEVDVAPREMGQFATFGEFTTDQLRDLLDEVERDLKKRPLAERVAKRYYVRGIRNRLLGGGGSPNPPCVALQSHLRLYPNGAVPVCQFNSGTVGNLREQSFAEVWAGVRRAKMRDWVKKCPGCWAECEVLPSALYTGDLLRETSRDTLRPRRQAAASCGGETNSATQLS